MAEMIGDLESRSEKIDNSDLFLKWFTEVYQNICQIVRMRKFRTVFNKHPFIKKRRKIYYTAISIRVVHEQSGKVECERERLLGIAYKLINFQSDSQQPFALLFDFSALLVDNLN
jgi:hypothetical protein